MTGLPEGYHRCPIRRCTRSVPDARLMCYGHWQMTPHRLQRNVYTAYARGAGMEANGLPGPALAAAQLAAITAVNAQLTA